MSALCGPFNPCRSHTWFVSMIHMQQTYFHLPVFIYLNQTEHVLCNGELSWQGGGGWWDVGREGGGVSIISSFSFSHLASNEVEHHRNLEAI